jgi:hypothetical protein
MKKIKLIFILFAIVLSYSFHVVKCYSKDTVFWGNLIVKTHSILYNPKFIQQIKSNYRSESLYAKLSILQYSKSPNKSLKTIKGLSEDFYRSLALGGIASIEQKSNPEEAEKLYIEALNQALKIDHWVGSDASSMGYLFQLIPNFKDKQNERLLDLSWNAFENWKDSPQVKSHAMLILSQITTAVKASLVKEVLLHKALKSNHYGDSIELLSKFLYKNAPLETLRLAQEYYDTSKDWPMCNNFLRAVLIEHATNNFEETFERVKKMRSIDQEIACMKLSEKLVEVGQKEKAIKVLDHLDSLVEMNISRPDNAVHVQAQGLSTKLRREMKEGKKNSDKSDIIEPEMIDNFLGQPTLADFNKIIKSNRMSSQIQFHNIKQAEEFISKGLLFAKEIRGMGYPHHGSPRSTALGTLALIAAKIDSPEQVMNITNEISIPELRAFYLMEAYEENSPLPSVIKNWPMRFWNHKVDINLSE